MVMAMEDSATAVRAGVRRKILRACSIGLLWWRYFASERAALRAAS
jgi:hypothetical protein